MQILKDIYNTISKNLVYL